MNTDFFIKKNNQLYIRKPRRYVLTDGKLFFCGQKVIQNVVKKTDK